MKSKKGFTLIELVVVMAIIAVLAMLVVGAIIVARNAQIRTANMGNAKTIQTALEAEYGKNGTYAYSGYAANEVLSAAKTDLNVTLGSGACDTSEGGRIVSADNDSYSIEVYDENCTAGDADNEFINVGP
jgi:prepilin-type N-terminal cleavage/methylation domain-containing protein